MMVGGRGIRQAGVCESGTIRLRTRSLLDHAAYSAIPACPMDGGRYEDGTVTHEYVILPLTALLFSA
jgi:hypothetical protein